MYLKTRMGRVSLVLRGVDIPEPMERDKSGMEPAELLLLREVSGRELRAADMACYLLSRVR
jgi:hypothetical protein